MLPIIMTNKLEFIEYVDANGFSPFAKWFDSLDAVSAAKVRVYMTRVELGNYSNVASIGGGLSEIKIDYGPGLRVYFREEKKLLLLLLGGSTKRGQQKAIDLAKVAWKEFNQNRKQPIRKERG